MKETHSHVYASFTRRACARLLDFFVVLDICGLLYLINRLAGFPVKYGALFNLRNVTSLDSFMYYNFPGVALTFIFIKLSVAFPYFALMESSRWQGTLGKLLTGIKVTDLRLQRISFGRATGRFFLKSVSVALFMLGYLVSFSDRKQGWHDYIAKVLVVRRNISPLYALERAVSNRLSGISNQNPHLAPETWDLSVLPRSSSRWLFEVPHFGIKHEEKVPATGYMCVFCDYHSEEKHLGCPRCGRPFAYGEVAAMKGIQIVHGAIFTTIGVGLLFIGAKVLLSELQLPYPMAPWWVFVMIFGLGFVFASGGLSSFFGKSWLIGLLLLLVLAGNRMGSKEVQR